MNREDIIDMARKAHLDVYGLGKDHEKFFTVIEHFAALVASAERERLTDAAMKAAEKAVDVAMALEREACAKLCEEAQSPPDWNSVAILWKECRNKLAEAIRARG